MAIPGIEPVAQSPVYETQPVGAAPEHRHLLFLNAVLIVDARMEAEAMSREIHRIEREMGRMRDGASNSPRPIDIDVIYAGGIRLSSPALVVPHARWAERRFVVRPLADVRPDLVIPGAARTVREVLHSLPAVPAVRLFAQRW